jgi:hypothetical protein
MHQNNLYNHESSMQAHLASHLQQQNTQELLNQSRFYLDNRRSYSPIENKQQISAQMMDSARRSKNRDLGSKELGCELRTGVFLVEEEVNEWRERGWGGRGAPHHDQARPRVGARLAWVWPPQVDPQCLFGTSRSQMFQKKLI